MKRSSRPTSGDLARLDAFLSAPARPEGTLSLGELYGLLFAVACSPETIRFQEILEMVFGGGDPGFVSEAEVESVMGVLVAVYNDINEGVVRRWPRLPQACALRGDPMANLEPDAPVAAWCQGFITGHTWLEELWDQYALEEWEDELGAVLAVLSCFASREVAEDLHEEGVSGDRTLEDFVTVTARLFPEAMASYANMGRSIHEALMEAEGAGDSEPPGPSPFRGVGRNDPCPCGSGRKFKRCCGASGH